VCRWQSEKGPKWQPGGPIGQPPCKWSLSLIPGEVLWNGPEPSRARRCWARPSEPLTARTVPRQLQRGKGGRTINERWRCHFGPIARCHQHPSAPCFNTTLQKCLKARHPSRPPTCTSRYFSPYLAQTWATAPRSSQSQIQLRTTSKPQPISTSSVRTAVPTWLPAAGKLVFMQK